MRVLPSAIAIAVFFALLPAVAGGGAMAMPVLLCLAGAAAFSPTVLRQAVENRPWWLWFLLAFSLWAGISSMWSAQPGSPQAYKLAALVPLGLLFATATARASNRELARAAAAAAFFVLAALLAVEIAFDMPLNRAANPDTHPGEVVRNLNRGITVLLALTWAAAAALLANRRAVLAGAVILIAALPSLPFGLWANVIAFGVGLAAFALAFAAPRIAIIAVSGGLAVWMLAAPFVTPLILANPRLVDALPESWAQRAGIWDYVCAEILERPWIGRGLDAARAVSDRIEVRGVDMRAIPLHPHSGSLQIWYETGAVGAVLAALTLVAGGLALARAFKDNRIAAAAAAASLASLGVIANVSFGIWQEWWNATMFVVAALVGALSLRRA